MRDSVANAALTVLVLFFFFPGKMLQPDRTRFPSCENAEEDQGLPPCIAQYLLTFFHAFPPLPGAGRHCKLLGGSTGLRQQITLNSIGVLHFQQ